MALRQEYAKPIFGHMATEQNLRQDAAGQGDQISTRLPKAGPSGSRRFGGERAVRPVTLEYEAGGDAAAIAYTLIETCKMVNPE